MLNLTKCQFVKSAAKKNDFLKDKKQVVFLGRSNVGKSSLINALVNNKKLAYVSSTPGRTKLISFFSIEDKAYLVDAPGYGYFKDGALDFEDMMLDYFSLGNKVISKAYVLLDSRRLELSNNDLEVLNMLKQYNIPYTCLFTKCDKLNMSERAKLNNSISSFNLSSEPIFTSSKTGDGIMELRKDISNSVQ